MLLLAAAVIFIPVGLLEAIDDEIQEPLTDPDGSARGRVIEIIVAAFVIGAGALLGDVLYAGIVAAVVIAERREHEGRSLRELLASLPVLRLIAVDLLLGLVVVLGFLMLVVPAFVFLTWFALVAPVVKVEHTSIIGAFRRSRELVRGHFWLVFVFVVPIVIAGEALAGLAQRTALELLGETFVGDWAGATVADLLTAPLYALASS